MEFGLFCFSDLKNVMLVSERLEPLGEALSSSSGAELGLWVVFVGDTEFGFVSGKFCAAWSIGINIAMCLAPPIVLAQTALSGN